MCWEGWRTRLKVKHPGTCPKPHQKLAWWGTTTTDAAPAVPSNPRPGPPEFGLHQELNLAHARKPPLVPCCYLLRESEVQTHHLYAEPISWHCWLPQVSSRQVWLAAPGDMVVYQQQSKLRTSIIVSKLGSFPTAKEQAFSNDKGQPWMWQMAPRTSIMTLSESCTSPNFL